ncbi:MAG TPA: hypothetical protein VKV20_09845 [Ktedonobacteraceae bacterium]|nr:hypothetical protein [Ktedonobacteraceae bacterium]
MTNDHGHLGCDNGLERNIVVMYARPINRRWEAIGRHATRSRGTRLSDLLLG